MNKTQIKRALAVAAFDPKSHIVAQEATPDYCIMRARELLASGFVVEEDMIKVMQLMAITLVKLEDYESCAVERAPRGCNSIENHCIPKGSGVVC